MNNQGQNNQGQEDVKKSISLKFRLNGNVCRRPSGRLQTILAEFSQGRNCSTFLNQFFNIFQTERNHDCNKYFCLTLTNMEFMRQNLSILSDASRRDCIFSKLLPQSPSPI